MMMMLLLLLLLLMMMMMMMMRMMMLLLLLLMMMMMRMMMLLLMLMMMMLMMLMLMMMSSQRAKETSTMSCGTRMKAFVVCFCLGVLMCFLGVSMLWLPGLGISIFAAFYTAGNVFALLSITFLVGPCKQLKSMCAIERAFATILMLAFMVLTVLGTFWWKIITLSLIFCACQFLAFTWYALSYVPFAR
ncbi:Vesicle transport protein SFT2A SFT2 domain-containing protein 1 [Takifugu flavidus]|uniref:Vesicle transport protein n=1 Tax=Takifugu flavidus TaxID=433684 RepID=A0A5C6N9D9_9TELE|nr:Vesicle transport protein SFT2A SFT2 domain-containing protein 1 [Takifugu flavidus]